MKNINCKYFYDKLNNVFDSNIKTVFKEEHDLFENIISKDKNIVIKSYNKTDINIEDFIFIESLNVNYESFKKEYNKNGKSIFILYKNQKPILINGDWDSVYHKPIEISKKIYIGVYKNNLCGIINEKGIIKIKPIYNDILNSNKNIELLENEYFWFKKGHSDYNYGLINIKGEELSPFEYFISGKKIIKNETKKYLLAKTKKGECVFSLNEKKYVIEKGKYKKLTFNEDYNLFIVKNIKNKLGIIQEYEEIIPAKYDSLNIISNDFILVSENKKIGAINLKNEIIIELKYDKINELDEHSISLLLGEEKYFFDKAGNLLKKI